MNTHLVFIFALLLVAAGIKADSHQLDAAGLFFAAIVAAIFAVANIDTGSRSRPLQAVRAPRPRVARCVNWTEQNSCVLCAGASS
jgi:uncharacterized membrane protein YiaA